MTDEIKSAETVLTETKAEISKLGADEKAGVTWVKAHWLYIVGALCFIAGWATRFIHI